jgi:hypothetical protein
VSVRSVSTKKLATKKTEGADRLVVPPEEENLL